MALLWTLIFVPTIIILILIAIYMVVSVTCRPFWQYKQEIRSALHTIYRVFVRDFITGFSRHYVLLDEIALEPYNFTDKNLEEDLNDSKSVEEAPKNKKKSG